MSKRRAISAMLKARRKADRLLDRSVVSPTKEAYEKESSGIIRGLSRMFRGSGRRDLDASSVSKSIRLLGSKAPRVAAELGSILSGTIRGTLTEGVHTIGDVLAHIRRSSSPLDDLTVVSKIVATRQNNLEMLQRRSSSDLVNRMMRRVANRMSEMPVEGLRISDLITETGELLDKEWWQIERMVRTETSYAYNVAQLDGLKSLAREREFSGKLYSRWTEMVNDLTGQPMDNRVGDDSIALHGQLARPGMAFVMPSGAKVQSSLQGKSWVHPPNRPNDRAILTPWMSDWGVPGWILTGGGRLRL